MVVAVVAGVAAPAPALQHRRCAHAHGTRRIVVDRRAAEVDTPVQDPQEDYEAAYRAHRDPHHRTRVGPRPLPAVASGDRAWGVFRVLPR